MYRTNSTDPADNNSPAWLASFNGAEETVIGEGQLLEPDPRHHAADEARLLGHRQQGIERPAAHQPEVAGVERDVDLGRARQ